MKIRIAPTSKMSLVLFAAVSSALATVSPSARVGALDYIEGTALVDGKVVSGNRDQLPILDNGESLSTAEGHAEMLLTPGVFLRLDAHSQARLLNASLTDTHLRLEQGAAMLEVDNLHKDNLIRIDVGPGTVRILKDGQYRFAANPATVQVFNGQVEAAGNDSHLKAGKSRQLAFAPAPVISKFKSAPDDDLSRWSRLRSEYEAEASVASAQYVGDMGWPWAYSDWFWNPWFDTWTWFPGSGMCMNPYGFAFFSPGLVYDYFPMRYYGSRRFGFTPGARGGAFGDARSGLSSTPRFRQQMGYGATRMPGGRMGMGRMGMGRTGMGRTGMGRMSVGRGSMGRR